MGRSAGVTKVSPVDAARLSTRLSGRIGCGAAVLAAAELVWCRTLAIPSVRTLAAEVGCAPSSILRPGRRRLVDVYAEVIAREWQVLDAGWFSAHPRARAGFFRRHVHELHARDPVLQRLPGLVLAARAGVEGCARLPPTLAVPWFALGAFAADGSFALSA